MKRVVVTDKALRELVNEALDGGWAGDNSPAAKVNAVVDHSAADTEPVNPSFVPQDKVELNVAVNRLARNLPNTDVPMIWNDFKSAVDRRTEKEEWSEAERIAQMGSQEAIDDAEHEKKQEEGHTHMDKKSVEEALRAEVRKHIAEAMGAVNEAPPDPADVQADEDPDEPEDAEGKPKRRTKAYKDTAIGGMSDVGGASFEEIAKEMGMSVAGGKQLVDKAIGKARFIGKLSDDDYDILVLTAANEYIEMLNSTGELTPADVQLMRAHPAITTELDGFREFLHNRIRRARKEAEATA